MSDGKIRDAFNDEQFEAFCAELVALPKKERTLEGIAAFFSKRTGGQYASKMAARTFVNGPLKRWVEKAHRGRELGEALKEATGAGVDRLGAIEEVAVIELQDHVLNAEEGKIDVEWLAKQLVKLRTSISMRQEQERKLEASQRNQADLERKLADSEHTRDQNERRTRLLEEKLTLVQWDAAKAAIAHAKEIRAVMADKSLDEAQRTERVRAVLFGAQPADFRPVETKGAQAEEAPEEGKK